MDINSSHSKINTMPRRILIIINTLNVGGAETFIMKVFRAINRQVVLFDFLVCEKKTGVYEPEVESLGGRVYHGCYKVKNPFKNLRIIYKTVHENKYETVLIFSQHPIVFFDLLVSKLGGAKKRVVRSTNSACGGRVSSFIAQLFRPLMNNLITTRLAPSKEAALWLFGERIVNEGKCIILNNGLDLSVFKFDELSRKLFREELGISNETVIGHVGRFNFQKNHLFLIDIFNAYHQLNPNSKLVLIGKGETKEQVIAKVKDCGLNTSVIFLDVRSDIPCCLNGFDAFVFPSLYEGMPNTVVEAQSCGLPCLVSDTITKEAQITDLVVFNSLNDAPQKWAKEIDSMISATKNRMSYGSIMKEQGYSIDDVSKKFLSVLS